jgi:hypothetical protein
MILRDWMFVMITISVVVIGFSQFYTSLAINYNIPAPTQDLGLYNLSTQINSITENLQGNTTGLGNVIQGIPILGSFAAILIAAVQVILVMLTQVPIVFGNMLTSLSSLSGNMIPSWFIGFVFAGVILAILWSVISQAIVKGRV